MDEQQDEYRLQRLKNLEGLRAAGYEPFGAAFERSGRLAEIRAGFAEGRHVTAAARLTTIRHMGKSAFADLRDGSDRFQIFVGKQDVGDDAFAAFRLLDMGDHVGVEGDLFTTRTGEPTIRVTRWTLLSKALQPLPEKWHGLKDVDQRYRQRYLDLIANPDVRTLFERRIRIINEIRSLLVARGFAEVETPMIQAQAGGAAAKPFVTHYTALGCPMFLRIAPELYLKRLLVGGFDRVFELNRNFRNEGLSRTHNPEFTMLEVYEAYTDLRGMQALIQALVTQVAQSVCGGLKVGDGDLAVDLTLPWREAAYRDLIRERMGPEWFELDVAEMRRRVEAAGLSVDPAWDSLLITHEVYEKLIEKTLIQPTFVTRFPAALVPLAKPCADDPTSVDVFELVIRGQEVAPAYTELNDPLIQRQRLLEQAGADAQAVDEDFLLALEHGMPPAGGMGVGIDRLVMVLTGAESIRDVILFPQLKPRT
ncbi:MAG: lysine--tRNA ligase [Lentisphaerae bacterium RIFOXYC12_FULL_60_16]|nr:MAG: lysine--tRNA ligase [Lentisphaerae bacterium RIFOXYC12_FULL_60_16]